MGGPFLLLTMHYIIAHIGTIRFTMEGIYQNYPTTLVGYGGGLLFEHQSLAPQYMQWVSLEKQSVLAGSKVLWAQAHDTSPCSYRKT